MTHTILRGAVNKHGKAIPNYHYEDLRLLFEKYSAKNLKNMATIVDTNHSNSNKQYEQQIRIAKEVLHSRQVDSDVRGLVKGLMIESYIEPGNQKIGPNHVYGKSITDACLGWEESEKLLYTIAEMCASACLKNHSRNLHAPLCGIFSEIEFIYLLYSDFGMREIFRTRSNIFR